MKKINVLLFFLIINLLVFTSFLFAQDDNEITLTVDFPSLKITSLGDYCSLSMQGAWNYGAPGEPVMPVKTVEILIPYGKTEGTVSVELGEKIVVRGSYLIEPGQQPVPISYKGPVKITPADSKIYKSDNSYPAKVFSEPVVQFKNGARILIINLYPVHYVPSEGKISYYKKLTVHVSLASENKSLNLSNAPKYRGIQSDISRIKNLVDNPEVLETYPSYSSLSRSGPSRQPFGDAGPYQYVIITNTALSGAIVGADNDFPELAAAKIANGITATIVAVENIYLNYTGADNQEKIRSFIIDAYNDWGTEYVLLGGDADGENVDAWVGGVDESEDAIVPARNLWAMTVDGDEGDYIPSDMYYSCLDGDFDADGDGKYGEYPSDNPDFTAEVYIGRACVDSANEVSNFVEKTLHYESTTDPYLLTARMVGERLDDAPTWGGDYKDEVKNGSDYLYTTVGFPTGTITTETLYDRDEAGHDWPSSDIIGIINGNVHLINHMGHGDNVYCMKMENWQPYYSDVDDLTNDEFFIGYSQACYSGAFDNWYATWEYIPYDCILEHFTTASNTGGAVAFIGNSRYGWYNSGGTNGSSQRFDRQFWDALFGENIFELGKMNADSKEDNIGYMSSSAYGRYCAYELNLLGDPELFVRIVSSEGAISIDRDYYTATATVYITVWDSDLEGAGTVTVELTSDPTADVENNITLTETGASTGVFTGSINLVIAAALVGDGTLQVAIGDTITATYTDANYGGGGVVDVTDTAEIVSLDTPTGLTANSGNTYAFLHWNAITGSVLGGYNIYRSTSLTGTKTRINGASSIENNSFQDIYLSADTTYYYWVTAEDIYGNETDYSSYARIITGQGGEDGNGDNGDDNGNGGGESVGTLKGCFIATACYGTPMAKEVRVLSQFRDEYLLTNSLGRIFVGNYYKFSPRIASFISEHPRLKNLVRWSLKPVVKVTDLVMSGQ